MRSLLQTLHLWLGLILGLPLVLIGVTGSILVFQSELESVFSLVAEHRLAEGTSHSIPEILEAAKAAAKPDEVISGYSPPQPGSPAKVSFSRKPKEKGAKPGKGSTLLLDPVTLEILPLHPESRFFRTVKKLHTNLLLEGRIGRQFAGWLGLVMLAMALSGIVLWWPRNGRWKQAFTVKKGARGYRLHRDLHGASAIWLWLVLFVAAFSGVYLAFPEQTTPVIRAYFSGRDLKAEADAVKVKAIEGAQAADIETVVSLAEKAVPDARINSIRFPSKPEQAYRISMELPAHENGPGITVYIDPWQRKAVLVHDPRTYNVGEILISWQRAIHGAYGVSWLWWKIVMLATGLLPALLAVTGLSMWLKKR